LRIPSALVVARSNSQGIFVFKITMEKKCTKCKEVKSLDEFSNAKHGKHGKQYRCKDCDKEYKENNREKVNEYSKEHRLKNKEYHKEYSKIYHKEYYKNNKEKSKEQSKKYREKHREKINKYMNKWYKEKRKIDTVFKLSYNIRANILISLKKNGYNKKTKTYTILKCDYNFFMKWLNGLASNSYTYGIGDLHLDHVIPISLAETENELLLLSHYSNYQLLSADENLTKGNRYVNPLNLARVLEHHPNPEKIKEIHARL